MTDLCSNQRGIHRPLVFDGHFNWRPFDLPFWFEYPNGQGWIPKGNYY